MREEIFTFTAKDFADVTRVLARVEQSSGDCDASNGKLLAELCREWESRQGVASTPPCAKCGGKTVKTDLVYTCIVCHETMTPSGAVPLSMPVHPKMFACMQTLRKRLNADSLADVVRIAVSVYANLIEESEAGTEFYGFRNEKQVGKVELFPHAKK